MMRLGSVIKIVVLFLALPGQTAERPPNRTAAEIAPLLTSRRTNEWKPCLITLVASKQDHGPGEHDYPKWQTNWFKLLSSVSNVTVQTAWKWPSPEQFEKSDLLVFYYWNHDWSVQHYRDMDAFQQRGGGLVILHSACIEDRNPEELAKRIGLAAHPKRTKYRHGKMTLNLTDLGVAQTEKRLPASIEFVDEPYWPMIGDPGKVQIWATAHEAGADHPMIWTYTQGKGRVFVSILGHYSWTYEDPFFRAIISSGFSWCLSEPPGRFPF